MKNKRKRVVRGILSAAFAVCTAILLSVCTIHAADNGLKICIGDSTAARHHRAVRLEEQTEELSFVLSSGKAKSSKYVSSNPSSFQVVDTTEGKCVVKALSEGSGLVTLTVKTTDGDTYTEKLFVSVYTPLGSNSGVANKNTNAYMGASTNSGVENYDNKGSISKDTALTITASCESFYIFKTQDGTTFQDDKDTGFVKKSDINILADKIVINGDHSPVDVGGKVSYSASVTPELAADRSVSWSSSDSKIASVNSSGQVTGRSEGTAAITATTKDGTSKKAVVYVSVCKPVKDCQGKLKSESNLWLVANDVSARGTGAKDAVLTIVAQCGTYYKVKMEDTSVYTDGKNSEYCFVPKSRVTIPVQKVSFTKPYIKLVMGGSQQLESTVEPSNADNKKVVYTSDNPKVAMVDQEGKVTAYRAGTAVITVTTEDGNKSASCDVYVSPAENPVWNASAPKKNTKKRQRQRNSRSRQRDTRMPA